MLQALQLRYRLLLTLTQTAESALDRCVAQHLIRWPQSGFNPGPLLTLTLP